MDTFVINLTVLDRDVISRAILPAYRLTHDSAHIMPVSKEKKNREVYGIYEKEQTIELLCIASFILEPFRMFLTTFSLYRDCLTVGISHGWVFDLQHGMPNHILPATQPCLYVIAFGPFLYLSACYCVVKGMMAETLSDIPVPHSDK